MIRKIIISFIIFNLVVITSSVVMATVAYALGITVEPAGDTRAIYFAAEKMSGSIFTVTGYILGRWILKEWKHQEETKNDRTH